MLKEHDTSLPTSGSLEPRVEPPVCLLRTAQTKFTVLLLEQDHRFLTVRPLNCLETRKALDVPGHHQLPKWQMVLSRVRCNSVSHPVCSSKTHPCCSSPRQEVGSGSPPLPCGQAGVILTNREWKRCHYLTSKAE